MIYASLGGIFFNTASTNSRTLCGSRSLLAMVWAGLHFFTAHPLQSALTLAVLGIFDVFARVQERSVLTPQST